MNDFNISPIIQNFDELICVIEIQRYFWPKQKLLPEKLFSGKSQKWSEPHAVSPNRFRVV